MKNSDKKIKLAQVLAKRLYPVTLAIGFLISLGTPTTFYAIESNSLKRTADLDAEHLADHFSELANPRNISNSALWKYQSPKFIETLNYFGPKKELVSIQILDEQKQPIEDYEYQKQDKKWWNEIVTYGSAPIIFNNRQLGSVKVSVSQGRLLEITFWLLLASTATGTSLAILVYRFPVRIAKSMETKIQKLFNALELSNRENESARLAAQTSEKRFRDLVQGLDAIVWEAEGNSDKFLFVSQRAEEILGYPVQKWLEEPNFWEKLIHPQDRLWVSSFYRGERIDEIEQILEYRAIAADGREVWLQDSIEIVTDENNQPRLLRGVIVDITEKKQAQKQLEYNAIYDKLTGLLNRASIVNRLELLIDLAKRKNNYTFALLFLDLDRFKIINDSLGHLIGDRLLISIAERLGECVRSKDNIGRLGGDEFVILLEDIEDIQNATQVAQRIQSELTLPFHLNGHEVFITTSIGITLSTTGYNRADEVLRDADAAMYRAKAMGKNRYEVFDKTMHAQALIRLQLENDLRRAIEREEFVLYYQPIVCLKTFKLVSFEALIRWQHPERGFISPADFIPIAEDTGMIIPIGEWVLWKACLQMNSWKMDYDLAVPLSIGVNVSSHQFSQPTLVDKIKQILFATGLNSQDLTLEITENAIVEAKEASKVRLREIRDLGVKLAIDDFGTGYSSLSYLSNFPFNTLKIDRSFVDNMEVKRENRKIVQALVSLAQNIGMNVVAEGIETTEQTALLEKLQCQYGQGYLFSKPLDAEGIEEIFKNSPSSTFDKNLMKSYREYQIAGARASITLV